MIDTSSVILNPDELAKLSAYARDYLAGPLKEGAWYDGFLNHTIEYFKVLRLKNPALTVEEHWASFPKK